MCSGGHSRFVIHGFDATDYSKRALFPTRASREIVIMKFGAVDSMNQTLGRLVELVESLTKEEQ